jgi:VanZ family protein
MKFLRLSVLLFALFLLLVIVLANTGKVGDVFGWVYYIPYGDKVGHFVLWGILALLVSLAYPTSRVQILSLKILKSNLIVCIAPVLEEISQLFFPERSASLIDLAAGLVGIFILGEVGAWLQRHLFARGKNQAMGG